MNNKNMVYLVDEVLFDGEKSEERTVNVETK